MEPTFYEKELAIRKKWSATAISLGVPLWLGFSVLTLGIGFFLGLPLFSMPFIFLTIDKLIFRLLKEKINLLSEKTFTLHIRLISLRGIIFVGVGLTLAASMMNENILKGVRILTAEGGLISIVILLLIDIMMVAKSKQDLPVNQTL